MLCIKISGCSLFKVQNSHKKAKRLTKQYNLSATTEQKYMRITCYIYFQTGFFRTSINALFEVSGPMLRLERRDSRRDLTTGRDVGPLQDPTAVWPTRLTGPSLATWSHSSSMMAGSSVGREERLHVDGRGVFTSSRISSLDLEGLSSCPAPLPPELSSGQRGSFSMLPAFAGLPSDGTTERQYVIRIFTNAGIHYF